MTATVTFVLALAIAGIILLLTRTRVDEPTGAQTKPTALSWLTLVFGLVAALFFAFGALTEAGIGIYLTSILCAFVAVPIGIGAILRRERHWPTWIGLAVGMVPALGWIAFAAGYILGFGE